jgi:VanZ family protein
MSAVARWATLALALVLVAIVVAADRTALPGAIQRLYAFPGGDKVGHAVLFGGLAFLATLAFPRRTIALGPVRLPLAAVVVTVLVALEEASQARFPGRTLSLADLAASCLGIVVGAALARMAHGRHLRRSEVTGAT